MGGVQLLLEEFLVAKADVARSVLDLLPELPGILLSSGEDLELHPRMEGESQGISEMIFKVFRHSLGVLPRPSLGAAASPAHSLTRRGNFTLSPVGPQAPKGVGWVGGW